jgi:acetyl esterase/lipase
MFSRIVFSAAVIAISASSAFAQNAPPIVQEPQTIPLWQGRAPGALGDAAEDVPTLTIYMPPNTTGPMTAVIVAPGGGYRALSMNKEGRLPAAYLNSLGIAAFVLKYRLGPKYHHPIELGDMQRAIRTVRARAAEWHIAPERIGVMGFSAGGHLASHASTHVDGEGAAPADEIDRASSRPNFAILGYPVISLSEAWRGARAASFDRYAGDVAHAADLSLPHECRYGSARGKQHSLLPRAANSRRACRDAHLQRRPTWRRHADERPGSIGVAESARKLAARERVFVTVRTIQKSVGTSVGIR